MPTMTKKQMAELEEFIEQTFKEATQTVEQELALEDAGWINLTAGGGYVIPDLDRQNYLKRSRIYYMKDPLARQAIRIWTDYTFGSGITYKAKDEKANEVLKEFWGARRNQALLSPRGQRRLSDKLLVDGEVFMALFLGPKGQATIRSIDPLEITEIITNPQDIEDVKLYRRQWQVLSKPKWSIYPSIDNPTRESCKDALAKEVSATEKALVAHLTYNTISQRGNPILLPALDWIDYYRRFLAARIAIMLARAKFAWKAKVKGGQKAVDAIKAKLHGEAIPAGSTEVENEGMDLTPIKMDTGARGAYDDGRMIKLQIASAVGIPEQYFGDISIGNLATAKTVELPMVKQFQSYQEIWRGFFEEIDEAVLAHNGVPENNWYVDRDFPPIGEDEASQIAQAIGNILTAIPELAVAPEVKQVALMALGINDTQQVLDQLGTESLSGLEARLARNLRELKEIINTAVNNNSKKLKVPPVIIDPKLE